jgi:aryl-alcohol dehydrogenase-like predicted oxidoreductase
VEKIGISIYDQYEIEKILEKYNIDLVQLPINIFDQRFMQSGYLKTLNHLGLEIHARSVFLQGLILADPYILPSFFDPIKNHITSFHEEMKRRNISKIEAALNFVSDLEEVDYVIVGVNNSAQLEEILQSFNKKITQHDFSKFAINNEKYVKPVNWKIN